jgi:hypothetical protein
MTLPIPDMYLPHPTQAKQGNDKPLSGAEAKVLNLVDRVCPKCSFNQPRRLPRTTWMERRFMPWLGFYPWECPLCRIHFYRKNRRDREERLSLEQPTEFGSGDFTSQELTQ